VVFFFLERAGELRINILRRKVEKPTVLPMTGPITHPSYRQES